LRVVDLPLAGVNVRDKKIRNVNTGQEVAFKSFFYGLIGCALERNRPDAVVGVVVSVVKSYPKGLPEIRLVHSLG